MDGNFPPIEISRSVAQRRPQQSLLEVVALTTSHGDQLALSDVAFTANAGEILGIIGPNGAGKTTLLECLAGILAADSGKVHWRGKPLPAAQRRRAMFYVPDGVRPYQDQLVAQVLSFFAEVYHRSDSEVADIIAAVGLGTVLGKRVRAEAAKGRSLLLAIHQLVDAERICDRFVLLSDGRVHGVGTLNDLRGCTSLPEGHLEDIFLALT